MCVHCASVCICVCIHVYVCMCVYMCVSLCNKPNGLTCESRDGDRKKENERERGGGTKK